MKNRFASLEPLTTDHAAQLFRASDSDAIWNFMPARPPAGEAGMAAWIADRLRPDHPGSGHVYLVRDAEGIAAGSTSVFAINETHRRCEVGFTWYGTKWHGSRLNPAVKLLILGFAFDELGMRRVQLKCDARNKHSFNAMKKLGASHEGTLRRHDMMWDGHIRDAEVFSILDSEWPTVRQGLEARLAPF